MLSLRLCSVVRHLFAGVEREDAVGRWETRIGIISDATQHSSYRKAKVKHKSEERWGCFCANQKKIDIFQLCFDFVSNIPPCLGSRKAWCGVILFFFVLGGLDIFFRSDCLTKKKGIEKALFKRIRRKPDFVSDWKPLLFLPTT